MAMMTLAKSMWMDVPAGGSILVFKADEDLNQSVHFKLRVKLILIALK